MKKTKQIMIIASTLVLMVSCNKKTDDTTPVFKTKTELITTGSWMMSDHIVDGISDWSMINACSKDDFMTYSKNGTVIEDEGAIKCVNGVPQTTTVNWAFTKDEKKIIVDGDTSNLSLLNETSIEISFKSGPELFVIKYKKK